MARERPTRMTGKKRTKRRMLGLVVASSSMALLLMAIEFFFVFFAPVEYMQLPEIRFHGMGGVHRTGSFPGLEYELIPDAETSTGPLGTTIRVNSYGLRGREVQLDKPPDLFRIAVVGDSFTFGHGVEDDETFPAHLEDLLNRTAPEGHRYEVLNFGVSGYSTHDEAIVIRNKVAQFAPDLVLLNYVLNDPDVHPSHGLHMPFHIPRFWERFHTLRWIAHRREQAGIESHGGLFKYLHGTPRLWNTVVEGFQDIRTASSDIGAPVALLLMPNLVRQRWKMYPYEELHEQVAEEGRKNGFSVVDIRLIIAEHNQQPMRLRLKEDSHPSSFGYRSFARAAVQFLREEFPGDFPSQRN